MHRALLVSIAVTLAIGFAATAAGADGVELTVLPRPAFPASVGAFQRPEPPLLTVQSSRYQDPGLGTGRAPVALWAPAAFRGKELVQVVRQRGTTFLLYGADGASARYLVAAGPKTHALRYAFDFARYASPPGVAPDERAYTVEQVLWARETADVLYVETAHLTYASASSGRNAYISAIAIGSGKLLWRSRALVANARTFIVAGDVIVSGYGFTSEPDYLVVLDRRTGRILDRLPVPSAPETIALHGDRLTVRTYDGSLVVRLRRP